MPLRSGALTLLSLLATLLFTFLTAYFLLASGDRVARKILTFGRTWAAKQAIIKASRGVQSELSA